MLIRNVGHLMTNPAILMSNGKEIPEGIMDAMITSMIAIHDIKNNSISTLEKESFSFENLLKEAMNYLDQK